MSRLLTSIYPIYAPSSSRPLLSVAYFAPLCCSHQNILFELPALQHQRFSRLSSLF
jgi:hypothetical protein